MKALLRPLFVGGLSVAIAATTLVGSSSVALAATRPTITALSVPTSVNEGDKPTVTGSFTDPDAGDQHTIQISWGDGSMDFYTLTVGDRSFSVQKSVGYPTAGANLSMQFSLSDGLFTVTRFPTITVNNVDPSITSFSLSSTDLNAGSAVTASGGFDDPGTAETHTVTVAWGDGTTNTVLNLARRVFVFTTPAHTYTAGGTFTVTATVADSAGGSAVATATVTVHGSNQAPSVVSFAVAATSEGDVSTLTLTFSDPDASDTHTVSVAWGDASSTGPVSLDSTVTTYSTTHTYADSGTYQVGLTLDDNAGHSVTAPASVSVANVAPSVGALTLSPASVVDHETVSVSGDFVDPGTLDTFTLLVDWGDGTSSTQSLVAGARRFSATHAYDAEGSVTIKATVTDRDNGAGSSSADLVVRPSNHAPADLALSASAALEGGSTALTVNFTDAEASDTHTVAVNWGDGSSDSVALAAGATTTSPSHTYSDSGSYTVAVIVTDDRGLSATGGTTINVGNVAPVLATVGFSPASVTDHQTLTLNASFTDPGTADTFTVSVDWGDGTEASTQSLAAGTRTFSATHSYGAAGTYLVSATVTDRDGGANTKTSSVVIRQSNRAPSSLTLSPTVNGSTVVVAGNFSDPDSADTHTVAMNWGDGTTSLSLSAGVTSFTASYAYTATGTYTVTSTVTDPSGASTTANVQVVVTVAGGTTADLLDQMKALVQSFDLDRNTERWLVRRIDSLKASLPANNELCFDLKLLGKVASYGSRTLSSDQWAAVSSLVDQLEASAGCPGANVRHFDQKRPVASPVITPNPVPSAPTDKNKADKTEKTEKSASSDKDRQDKTEKKTNRPGHRE